MRWYDEEVESNETPEEALRSLSESLRDARRVKVYLSAPGVLTVEEQWIPAWAVLLAIVAFPIGLFALAAKRRTRLTISAEPNAGGCLLRVQGDAIRRLGRQIDDALGLVVVSESEQSDHDE